jgi:hypothetical protein
MGYPGQAFHYITLPMGYPGALYYSQRFFYICKKIKIASVVPWPALFNTT